MESGWENLELKMDIFAGKEQAISEKSCMICQSKTEDILRL